MKFSEYATPQSSLKYSPEYFASLTFGRAHSIDYPTIASPGLITGWCLDNDEPSSAAGTLVQPGEVVPHAEDLLPISRIMEGAYLEGSRSVIVQFGEYQAGYHFSKIRLLLAINNNKPAISSAHSLYIHITANNILLPPELERFQSLRIREPISGFQVTRFPLWTLACLLGETWLEEDVVNASLELLYLKNATLTNNDPTFIVLPTSFSHDTRYLFSQISRSYSSNISLLRRRLRAIPTAASTNISFVTCESDHFSAYRYLPKFSSLRLGDSMGRPSSSDILPAFNWVIEGMSSIGYSAPNTVGEGHMPRQGPQSGSCGIAAVNFITRGELPNPPIWDDTVGILPSRHVADTLYTYTTSAIFRNKALQEILVYHLAAADVQASCETWHAPCVLAPITGSEILTDDPSQPVGYTDFNLYRPTVTHPIHPFMARIQAQPLIALPRASPEHRPKVRLYPRHLYVSVNNPPSQLNLRTAPVSKLPALSASAPTIVLPDDGDDDSDDDDGDDNTGGGGGVIDLSNSSPVPAAKRSVKTSGKPKIKREVIDLTGITQLQSRSRPCPPIRAPPPPGTIVLPVSDDDDVIITSQSFTLGTEKELAKREPLSDLSNSQRRPLHVLADIDIGMVYDSFEEGQNAVYALEASRGHIWRKAQTKKVNDMPRRITLRCNHYHRHIPTHLDTIDPSDYRKGKTIKTDCTAHVNLCCNGDGSWRVSMTSWKHNHPPQLPPDGIISCPPTCEQQALVSQLCAHINGNFSRSQIAKVVVEHFPHHLLELSQISNMINKAHRELQQEVNALGGDMATIIAEVTQKSETEHGWRHALRLNDQQVIVGFWWQSPIQAALTKRYGDILLNDDTYNRNRYGYPPDIGIVIDGFGKSRNAWYSFHEREDIDTHVWPAPDIHPKSLDRHPSLITGCATAIPTAFHLYCLHHLDGNVTNQLRKILSAVWDQFRSDFWTAYRAVSPEEFDRLWKHLTSTYPTAQKYLDEELYPCRQHWAWAWVGSRVESENRVNKSIGGPKKTLLQLFRGLNECTNDQHVQDLIRHRQILWEHAGPFANQKCRREMEQSVFYTAEAVQLPLGKRNWDEYALGIQTETGYTWEENEEDLPFHISLIRARWLQDPDTDMGSLPAVTKSHEVRPQDLRMVTKPIPSLLMPSQPTNSKRHIPIPAGSTETLPAREVFHEVQAAIRPLMAHVETREQVADLLRNLDGIRQQTTEKKYRETIHDPPVIQHKGRPRTQRLTGAVEGRASGGGGTQVKKRRIEDGENIDPYGTRITHKRACRCLYLAIWDSRN
ncbi:hypothetical protein FB451DRAFT_1179375 [Mycena latifolia]|nr:hypothetical protein FB451DRAFT_1179375 [Mycena latifolia]